MYKIFIKRGLDILISSGAIVVIGFEKQQLITHHGVCKGLAPNAGNPLYDFQHWEIYLEDEQ